jgi:hypothetical protein
VEETVARDEIRLFVCLFVCLFRGLCPFVSFETTQNNVHLGIIMMLCCQLKKDRSWLCLPKFGFLYKHALPKTFF